MSICWGATDFGAGHHLDLSLLSDDVLTVRFVSLGYDMAKQTPYLDDMLRWSLDWLMKVRTSQILIIFNMYPLFLDCCRLTHNQAHCSSK